MIYFIPWLLVAITFVLVSFSPISFPLLFAVNIWGLSMPHTFSTYTRHDLRNKRTALSALLLFLLIIISLIIIKINIGLVIIYSIYFFWQQFHYTKQNMGIAIRKNKNKTLIIDHLFFLLVSLISTLTIFNNGNVQFFGYSLIAPIPFSLNHQIAILINIILLLTYCIIRPANWKMAISHTLIFSVSYIFLNNFALGWLLLNIFHNSQYLIFMKNHEKNYFFILYALLFSMLFYFIIKQDSFIELSIVLMLAMNFTHYLFDGFIWKRKFLASFQSSLC